MLTMRDADAVLALHREAAAPPSGLAREPDEIHFDYVCAFLARAEADGVAFGAYDEDALCGELHTWRMGPRQFAHVLTDLTIAVHPRVQGRGVGRLLFETLFAEAALLQPRIARIELLCRSGHAHALRLYESMGFVAEGRFKERVRLADGTLEDDIPMVRYLNRDARLSADPPTAPGSEVH
jgi:putative acetyltransferase